MKTAATQRLDVDVLAQVLYETDREEAHDENGDPYPEFEGTKRPAWSKVAPITKALKRALAQQFADRYHRIARRALVSSRSSRKGMP